MHNVFVYGTLKHGQSNHHLLKDAEFVGRACTVQPYSMHTTGGYPVVFDRPVNNIAGEVYYVNDEQLTRLDWLEGHPNFFERRQISVDVNGTGILDTVWMYFGNTNSWVPEAIPPVRPDATGACVWSR